MKTPPMCGRCGGRHWKFRRCQPTVIVHRPREGYREYASQYGDLEPAGTINGAPILRRKHRDPDSRAGSLRP